MADKREERFRVVPIARDERIAQDIDGDQYYRQRGDTVVDEVEIVSETPFQSDAGSTVIPKSDDVQQADYQVENPPMEEEVYYDAPESYEDESYAYEQDYASQQEEPKRKSRRAASHPASKPWYKKAWLYILLSCVVLVFGAVLYIRTDQEYSVKLAQIEKQVAEITMQMAQGDQTQGATLDDQIDFYNEQCRFAREQNAAFETLNREYWWIIGRSEASDIGLADLNTQVENLTPLLNNLGVFMEQVEQVVAQVKGTPEKPGHLLSALDLAQANDILENDRNMIANALLMCDELENLPEAFRRGKENLKNDLLELDAEVVLMQTYITALKPIETDVQLFCTAARDFYDRSFTNNFSEDLQAQYSVISRSDTIQANIQSINGQERFSSLTHYYGISDFELDEAGMRMLEEEGVVQTARNIVLHVRSQDGSIASDPDDRSLCAEELKNNAGYIEELEALALPDGYGTGLARYIDALEARAQYLDAHIDYLDALKDVKKLESELDALKKRRAALTDEITEALKENDMPTFREKTTELDKVMEDIADKQEEYNRANANVQPLLKEENRLYDNYQALVS